MNIPRKSSLWHHVRQAFQLWRIARRDRGFVVAWYAFWAYIAMWPEVRDAR